MESKLISIIVPIYNSEHYLRKCIESIVNQTYTNLDIILIDDGSTDNSLLIAEDYAKNDTRIRTFSQSNAGLIATRKRGLKLAEGELIGFVDSDDWVENNMFEQLAKYMNNYKCDLVSSGIFHDYVNQNKKRDESFDIYREGLYTDLSKDIYPSMLYDFNSSDMGLKCNLVNKLFKKRILNMVYDNIDTRVFYGEDALTVYQYCLNCSSIYILRQSYYHYLIRDNSMCRVANEALITNTYYLYKQLKEEFMRYKSPYILIKQLEKYIVQLEMHTLDKVYGINLTTLANWDFSGFNKAIGKRIVLYGAGACGQAFYKKLVCGGYEDTLVLWVDKNVCGKTGQCLPNIEPVTHISGLQYDYVVIAIKNEIIAKQVKEELIEQYNIDENKIIWEKLSYEISLW